jgi:CubicO group peptidase (beta-lactamase class C family)
LSALGKLIVTLGLALGCAPAAPTAALPRSPAPSPPSHRAAPTPGFVPFAFGTTDPARKAKFLALAPRLDDAFRKKLEETGATGLAVGILLDGELVYARGFGVAEVESARPVDENTVFRLASVTKGFTALGVMKLRDDGKLSLDAPIAAYLPELAGLGGPTRDAAPVTARLLLTNASGLAYDDLWGAETFGRSDAQLLSLLRTNAIFASSPGVKYAYSNLGWALLGQLVGRVSGVPFRDYLRLRIFEPLGMAATVWEASEVPSGRLATGYHREAGKLVPEVPASQGAFVPAGGLYTSLHDLARYVAFHALAYPPRDTPEMAPVRRSTLREMHQGQRWMRWSDKNAPVVERGEGVTQLTTAAYGFGWYNATSCNEEGRVSHGGFEPGYFANVTVMPEVGVGFALLATTGPAANPARAAALAMMGEAGLLAKPRIEPRQGLSAARAAIESLLGSWDEARFRESFDPDSLKYSWNAQLREDFAKLRQGHGACRADGELTTYSPLHADFRVVCERGAIRFDILLAPGAPERLQDAHFTTELPVDARAEAAFRHWLLLLGAWNESAAGELFAPAVDRARVRKTLARITLEQGTCKPDRGYAQVVHEASRPDLRAIRYDLSCSERPLELEFTLDAAGKIAAFSAHPPHAADATCWE